MVPRSLFRRQAGLPYKPVRRLRHVMLPLASVSLFVLILLGCRSWSGGIYRSTSSERFIEFKSGTAYITDGNSSQAVAYKILGDKVILKLPFMNEVLRRMPDGALSGMGETLVHVDDATAVLIGAYESSDGGYRLRLGVQGRAVYTRLGISVDVNYTVDGDLITLNQITPDQNSIKIPVRRHPDGSLVTPDAVLKKRS
jgi:hypothetical protein